MNIFRRLKNMWAMSAYPPMFVAKEPKGVLTDIEPGMIQPVKMAQIIHRKPKDPVKELVGEEQSPV